MTGLYSALIFINVAACMGCVSRKNYTWAVWCGFTALYCLVGLLMEIKL